MKDMLYEAIDNFLFPQEIDMLLDKAMTLCPAMQRHNSKMYPANVKVMFKNCTEDFAIFGAALLNDIAFNW